MVVYAFQEDPLILEKRQNKQQSENFEKKLDSLLLLSQSCWAYRRLFERIALPFLFMPEVL